MSRFEVLLPKDSVRWLPCIWRLIRRGGDSMRPYNRHLVDWSHPGCLLWSDHAPLGERAEPHWEPIPRDNSRSHCQSGGRLLRYGVRGGWPERLMVS
jgi:hypothetical protein